MRSSSLVVSGDIGVPGPRPVAKAFGAGSLMMYTFGIGRPSVIDRFSTMRYKPRIVGLWISCPPDRDREVEAAGSTWIVEQPAIRCDH
jgi:hypothetical protein